MSYRVLSSKGSQENEQCLIAVDAAGDALLTSSTVWREFFVPDGADFNAVNIRVGTARPVSADPAAVYEGHLWCHVDPGTDVGVGIMPVDYMGRNPGIGKAPGDSLGFFKSTTAGKSVVLWTRR